MYMAGESLTSIARRALPIRNRFTKPSKEKPFSVGMASSPSKTYLFGLRASKSRDDFRKSSSKALTRSGLQEDVFLIPENETTKSVPLRLVHPLFANRKAFHSPSLHRSNRRT